MKVIARLMFWCGSTPSDRTANRSPGQSPPQTLDAIQDRDRTKKLGLRDFVVGSNVLDDRRRHEEAVPVLTARQPLPPVNTAAPAALARSTEVSMFFICPSLITGP
jgi:hypothetical protein